MRHSRKQWAALFCALCLLCACAWASAETLPPCASRGDDPNHGHIPHAWATYTEGTHSAPCEYPGCTRWVRINCTLLGVDTPEGGYSVCPVCGSIYRNGRFTGEALTKLVNYKLSDGINHHKVLRGKPVVCCGLVGESTAVLTVCYEIYGYPVRHSTEVHIEVGRRAAKLLEGFRLDAIAGVADTGLNVTLDVDSAMADMRMVSRPAALLVFAQGN